MNSLIVPTNETIILPASELVRPSTEGQLRRFLREYLGKGKEWRCSGCERRRLWLEKRGLLNRRLGVHRPKFFQRGFIGIGFWSGGGECVQQSNVNTSNSGSGTTVCSGVLFISDGRTNEIKTDPCATTVLINAGEWWCNEPESGIGASYDVREQTHNSGTWDLAAAATGTWVNIGSTGNQQWRAERTCCNKGDQGAGTDTADGDFQIRDASSQVVKASFNVVAAATVV